MTKRFALIVDPWLRLLRCGNTQDQHSVGGFWKDRYCSLYRESNNPPFSCSVEQRRSWLEALSLTLGFVEAMYFFLVS